MNDEDEFKRLLLDLVDPLTCFSCGEFSYRVFTPKWIVTGSNGLLAPFCPECKADIDSLDRRVEAIQYEDFGRRE